MAKNKKRLTKKQRQRLVKTTRPYLLVLVGITIGFIVAALVNTSQANQVPSNLVWAADGTIKIPKDLKAELLKQNDCEHYRGTNSPKGIGLWSVYQVSDDKYAKIAYGCSWNLTSYIMAVRIDSKWKLIPPGEYFASFSGTSGVSGGALPKCVELEKYQINKSVESFCIQVDGTAKPNDL